MTATYCAIPSPDGPTLIHPRQYTCDERCKPVLVIDPEAPESELVPLVAMGSVENVRDVLRSLASPQPCPTCGAVAS